MASFYPIFYAFKGEFTNVTKNKVDLTSLKTNSSTVKIDSKGRAINSVKFEEADAPVFYFSSKTN